LAARHDVRDADVTRAENAEALAVERGVELTARLVADRIELRPVREETRHLQRDDVRIDLTEARRGERAAVDLLAPHLADHGDLVALRPVEVPGEGQLPLAVL